MNTRLLRSGVRLHWWGSSNRSGCRCYSIETAGWWMNFYEDTPGTLPMTSRCAYGLVANSWQEVGHAFMEMGRQDPLWPLLSLLYDWP